MDTIKQVPLTCGGHTRPVMHLDFSDLTREGYFLISACKDGLPMLRQGETGDWIGTFEGHKGAVWGVALTQDANLAASGSADFTAKLWDARYGDELHSFQHEHIVKSVNFNSDDTLLLTASNEKLIRIFDLNKPEAGPLEIISGHTNNIRHAVFLNDNKQIVSVSDDHTMRVWDRSSGQEVHKIEYASIPNSLDLSRDGEVLIVAQGQNVRFYSPDTMHIIREFVVPTNCYSASFAPNRETFVCGGEDLRVYKFDYNTGAQLESNKGHFGPVHCLRWSPDGELFGSSSEDGTVRLWQGVPGRVYGLWRRLSPATSPQPLVNGFNENEQ